MVMSMQKDAAEWSSALLELWLRRPHHDNTNLRIFTNPHAGFLKENLKNLLYC